MVRVQLHASVQAELRDPPAEHVPSDGAVLAGHLLTDLPRAQHVVPHIHIRHVAHERVLVWDPQEAVLVLPQDEHAPGRDGVAGPQVLLLPDHAVDPQLGATGVGRPGHAVVGPVEGAQVVGQADKLVADPQPHVLTHGDDELVVVRGCGVGEDGVRLAGVACPDAHAGREGLQAHGVGQVGQRIAACVALGEVQHQWVQSPRPWRNTQTKHAD